MMSTFPSVGRCYRPASFFLAAAASACAAAPDVARLPPSTQTPTLAQAPPDLAALPESDRAFVAEAVNAARAIVGGAEFAAAFDRMNELYATSAESEKPAFVLKNYLSHQWRTQYQVPKILCFFTKPCWGETADTGLDVTSIAQTNLRSCTLSRTHRSEGVGAFSCAINTLAHEWAHTIPKTRSSDAPLTWQYTDGSHDTDALHGKSLVTYTIGSLAQCIYLEHYGYGVASIEECVCRVGTAVFDKGLCDDDGARALSQPLTTPLCSAWRR